MKRWTPLLTTLLLLAMSTAAMACPFCKDSIPSSDAQAPGGVPSGFNTTIYFMLGSLFCMIAMVTMTLVKGARSSVGSRGGRGFPLK
jgi:hypothetical protein